MRRTRSTQAQMRRSNRAKKTVGLTSLFFPNALGCKHNSKLTELYSQENYMGESRLVAVQVMAMILLFDNVMNLQINSPDTCFKVLDMKSNSVCL